MGSTGSSCCPVSIDVTETVVTEMEKADPTNTTLTIQEVANRLGISTSELSELRLSTDDLPIERQGFKLFYQLQNVKAYERVETVKVIERVLATDRPLVLLHKMAAAAGLIKLKIAGKQVQPISVQQQPNINLARANLDTSVAHATEVRAEVTTAEVTDEVTTNQSQACAPRLHQPLNGSYPWYVVHTKPRQELVALENLERQGYCCYLPQFKLKKPKARKLIVIDEPMFPRYLFIGADALFEKKGTSFIRSTKGVHELVRFGTEPAQIRFELLQGIFDREQAQHSSPSEPFQTGDCVRVVDGPLAGLETIYQAQTGEERSMILLKLLNRPVQVQIATAQLRKFA
jgi:transcriptional antiterminator RfaH